MFNPGPEGDWDDQELLLLLHVIEGGDEKLTTRFLADLLALVLHEPAERVHEHAHHEDSKEGESEIYASNGVDTGQILGLLEVVTNLFRDISLLLDNLGGAVLGPAAGQDLVRDREVGVEVGGEHRGADDVTNDGIALEEEEKDSEELDDHWFRVDVLNGGQSVSYLERK